LKRRIIISSFKSAGKVRQIYKLSDLILIADDDELVLDTVGFLLENSGFRVLTAVNKDKMMKGMKKMPALVLLDVEFGDDSGFEIALDLRKVSNIPIIMLTGKISEPERVVGLELGADDYITKPFGTAELIARIKAVLRRSKMTSMPSLSEKNSIAIFNDWKCDLASRNLVSPVGQAIKLTSGEFTLLEALIKSEGRTMSREYLLEATGREDNFDRSIDIQVMRLRKKLVSDGETSDIIKSIRSVGYIFTPRVKWL
jgi:two-component system, OmpR family, response regulator